jgi:hypothetical protein
MTAVYITLGAVGAASLIVISVILFRRRFKEYKLDEADRFLVSEFRRCNVMVFGKKGSGKDVLFAHVIALRGEKHYSNIPYDDNTEVIELCEINAGDNTFEDCINGEIEPFEPRFDEACDIYISDVGIYFPNTLHEKLDKLYPSMPVFMALSRHLYNNNVHTNCQALGRPWKKIREQADSYIQVLRTRYRGDHLFLDIVGYEQADVNSERITEVCRHTVRVPLWELQYDSRYFRNVFLNRELTPFERLKTIINGR